MKKGDVVTVFGNPIKMQYPIGEAKLIKKVSDAISLEQWEIEYLNEPDHVYVALIKKKDGESTTK